MTLHTLCIHMVGNFTFGRQFLKIITPMRSCELRLTVSKLIHYSGERHGGPDHLIYIRQCEGLTGGGQHTHNTGQAAYCSQGQEVHTGREMQTCCIFL